MRRQLAEAGGGAFSLLLQLGEGVFQLAEHVQPGKGSVILKLELREVSFVEQGKKNMLGGMCAYTNLTMYSYPLW